MKKAPSPRTEPTWTEGIPSLVFKPGVASGHDLVQHTSGFDPARHEFRLKSGTLPAGVTLDPAKGYLWDGSGSPSGFEIEIVDKVGGGSGDIVKDDWIKRSTQEKVGFACDFTGPNDFVLASTNGGHVFANNMDPAVLARVTKFVDSSVPGGTCLRIFTPKEVGLNSAAYLFPFDRNFRQNSDNWGPDDIYICFRAWFPDSRFVKANGSKGWKHLNVAQYSFTNTAGQSYSNTKAEHVLQDTNCRGMPQAYHRDIAGNYPAFEGTAGGEISFQNMIDRGPQYSGDNRYCQYPGTPACWYFPKQEWITMQIRIRPVTYNGRAGNKFDEWVARRDATEWTHIMSHSEYEIGDPGSAGGGHTGLNGGQFNAYETGRTSSSVDTEHRITQLIVSRGVMVALPAVGA